MRRTLPRDHRCAGDLCNEVPGIDSASTNMRVMESFTAQKDRVSLAVLEDDHPIDRRITASFGVSASPQGTRFDTAYGLADAALYRAKRAGRNRVEVAEEPAT